MMPGDFVEALGLPTRVETKWVNGPKMRVDGKWVDASKVWRPAIYGGPFGSRHTFRYTDSRHFFALPEKALRTTVRKPRGSTASQEAYVRAYGELC